MGGLSLRMTMVKGRIMGRKKRRFEINFSFFGEIPFESPLLPSLLTLNKPVILKLIHPCTRF
jgi:hypothetical protein